MLDYYRFKEINELFAEGRYQEGRRRLMELQAQCIALRDEMDTLKTQVREFEDIIYLSQSLYFDRRFYWISIANLKQGPFCPECYDRDGTLIRLQHEQQTLYCTFCGTRYERPARAMGEEEQIIPVRQAKLLPFSRR